MNEIVKALYGEENSFDTKKFKNPPLVHAPIYNWIWNAPLSHEETDKQLDEMLRLGIQSLAIVPEPKDFRPKTLPTCMEPDYLTPAYFEQYRYAVRAAKERGMLFCLYDEGGWPSGGACGKVMKEHPEFAYQTLAVRHVAYRAGEEYQLPADALASFCKDVEITEGYRFDSDCTVAEYYIYTKPLTHTSHDLPDLTRSEATDVFLEMTHRAYAPYLAEFFGNTVTTVFSDEPTAPRDIPYRKEIEALFEKENGYSIRPFLPALLGEKTPTEQESKARIAWLDLCGRLFCENYLQREKAWSNQNGMAFIGHMDRDHRINECCTVSGNFHILRALRCFDIPGVDVIWHQITNKTLDNPCETVETTNGIFPRFASSAAAQIGARYSLTESMGVYGNGSDFDLMRYVFGYQAVRGINLFNLFAVPYGREDFLMTGELPYFTEKHACYRDLATFNSYAARLSYLASLGEREADVALYLPVCDLLAGENDAVAKAFDQVGKELEDSRILFDIADDDVLAHVEGATVKMGKAQYRSVIVPPCDFMPERTKAHLEAFASKGGRVFVVGDKPVLHGASYVRDAKGILPSPLALAGDTEKIRLCVRNAQNGTLFFLYNEADCAKTFEVLSSYDCVFDAENAKIIRPATNQFTLASGQSLFLWRGEVAEPEQQTEYKNAQTLANFTFRRTERFVIGDTGFHVHKIEEAPLPVSLGDWASIAGEDFSGSGIYTAEFARPKTGRKLCLDLGEVHSSCEVLLNGVSLGVRAMTPYRYELDAALLCAHNVLEIRVSNTSANEYLSTKAFDKWQTWQLGPYHEWQQVYHKASLQSGLYGPVKIWHG